MGEIPEHIDDTSEVLELSEFFEEIESNQVTYRNDGSSEYVVCDGWRILIAVRDKCLLIEDGVEPNRRTRLIAPPDRPFRVIVFGAGMVTTEAMTWCDDLSVPLYVIRGGRPVMIGSPARRYDTELVGAQWAADTTPLARWILDQRLQDMAMIAFEYLRDPDTSDRITAYRRALYDQRRMFTVEANAARYYWRAWRAVTVNFYAPAPKNPHWTRFEQRRSTLHETGKWNRSAGDPINAMLNYGYSVAHGEATIAILGRGLDPGIPFLHTGTDRTSRASLEQDVLELARGLVEIVILEMCSERGFRKRDFAQARNGVVSVRPPLSHELAAAISAQCRESLPARVDELTQLILGKKPTSLRVGNRTRRQR